MQSTHYAQLTDEVYSAWEKLWNASPYANYTNTPYWFKTVIEQFDYKKYAIIAVYRKNALVAVGGLVRLKKYGLSIYTVAPNDFVCGLPFLFDPTDQTVVKALHNQLLTLGTVFLDNVPETFVAAFKKVSSEMDVYPFSVNYSFPLKRNKKGIVDFQYRKKFFYRIKHEPEKFTLKTCTCKNRTCIDKAFAIDAVSSKRMYGYNCFSTRFIKSFYKKLAKNFKDAIRLDILYFEDKPIAYEIGFIAAETYYENQSAFMAAYQKYAPGNVITAMMLDALAADGIKKADFGSGDTHKKRLITQEKEVLYKVTISKNPVIRFNFHNLSRAKSSLYEKMEKNRKVYALYRKVKNVNKKDL